MKVCLVSDGFALFSENKKEEEKLQQIYDGKYVHLLAKSLRTVKKKRVVVELVLVPTVLRFRQVKPRKKRSNR